MCDVCRTEGKPHKSRVAGNGLKASFAEGNTYSIPWPEHSNGVGPIADRDSAAWSLVSTNPPNTIGGSQHSVGAMWLGRPHTRHMQARKRSPVTCRTGGAAIHCMCEVIRLHDARAGARPGEQACECWVRKGYKDSVLEKHK